MADQFSDNETFKSIDFSKFSDFAPEYSECIFMSCNFSNCNLANISFFDCRFEDCNFSMTKMENTSFKDASFRNCKIIGVDFSPCNDFLLSFQFETCILDYTFYYKKKLKKTMFKNCSLKEANFTDADFSLSSFLNCDLSRAVFHGTQLVRADFRTAINYSIDPEVNAVKKAKFAYPGLIGLLDKYDLDIE